MPLLFHDFAVCSNQSSQSLYVNTWSEWPQIFKQEIAYFPLLDLLVVSVMQDSDEAAEWVEAENRQSEPTKSPSPETKQDGGIAIRGPQLPPGFSKPEEAPSESLQVRIIYVLCL